jgi:hypothetical protein
MTYEALTQVEQRYCLSCRHHSKGHVCRRGQTPQTDPVTGKTVWDTDEPLCSDERTTGRCGQYGNFWQRKREREA